MSYPAGADDALRPRCLLMERDGELVLTLADNERLSKRVEALEAALEDSRSHFEGMPKGRVVPFKATGGKEER